MQTKRIEKSKKIIKSNRILEDSSISLMINERGNRKTSAFLTNKEKVSYYIKLITLVLLTLLCIYGLLTYNNPVPITSKAFKAVVNKRLIGVYAIIIAAACQSISTVTFQSLTQNKIITPSLLGFESLYTVINTSLVFFFGANVFNRFTKGESFILQVVIMIVFSILLYGLLLSSKYSNLHLMLLVGIIIGSSLRSLSSVMRKVLSPAEYDVLQGRLLASVNNTKSEYFIVAIPLTIVAVILIYLFSNKLNVMSLGQEVATNLGLNTKFTTIYGLILISILMAISTALIGPISFFGFLVAMLTYMFVPTYDHKYTLPMSLVLGTFILSLSYFIMNHIFKAQGAVSIIIEIVGGITFLVVLLKRGKI